MSAMTLKNGRCPFFDKVMLLAYFSLLCICASATTCHNQIEAVCKCL